MKLAEALSIRKDLQKRIKYLEERIKSNVKVQEDDELDMEIQGLNFLTELM